MKLDRATTAWPVLILAGLAAIKRDVAMFELLERYRLLTSAVAGSARIGRDGLDGFQVRSSHLLLLHFSSALLLLLCDPGLVFDDALVHVLQEDDRGSALRAEGGRNATGRIAGPPPALGLVSSARHKQCQL